MSKDQECTVDDGKCVEHCYVNHAGPVSVASVSLAVEAADYADKMERITGDFHRYEKELDGKYHVYGEEGCTK